MEKTNQKMGYKANDRHIFVLKIETNDAKQIHTNVAETISGKTTRFSQRGSISGRMSNGVPEEAIERRWGFRADGRGTNSDR
ncbi:hypothetical protein OXYTRIMIC_575 [Oxytricha trifallax]|uniref:Uncharacterized protein n=1 Tax=Oxytricha trifallax TaxID=1172189 RepID=A0A073HZ42_9SPIT|nr:hypothetical protein OXYTRIMIC_575 [Oxytricha trifallax]